MGTCYILVGKQVLNTGILGIFSKREDAEKQLKRLEKTFKGRMMYCPTKFEILEAPFNSTKVIDKCIDDLRKELGL